MTGGTIRVIKKIIGMMLAVFLISTMLNFASAAAATKTSFSDVSESDWFYTYVSSLSQNGVVSGYPDGSFQPDGVVTCGEALKLIILAAGYAEQPATDKHWASGYLRFASVKRFTSMALVSDLDAPISRLLFAQIAAKVLALPLQDIRSPFSDISDLYVTALYKKGIVQGSLNDDGALVYNAGGRLKRSEISAIIWRIKNTDSTPVEAVKKIQFGNYTLDVLKDVPVNSYDASSFSLSNGVVQYKSDTIKTYKGIDVSSYQGVIDWKKVKASGVDYVIIRLGYRGYETGKICLDDYFASNIKGALAAGLEVGVYFFSQAVTASEAIQEANFVLTNIKGYNITYPVVFDWETINSTTARTNGISTEALCSSAAAFCKTIADAGYKPTIYFNMSCGYLKYDLSKIKSYDFWLAEYSDKPEFYYNFQMWQYSSSGKVSGINGNVDMNICFKTY